MLTELHRPIVAAPMAGGVSTPALAAATASGGGLGFLAGGYRTVAAMAQQIQQLRALTSAPFGVNLFVPGRDTAQPAPVAAYRDRIAPEAHRLGVEPGPAEWHDDDYSAKVAHLAADPVAVVSFTFGLPTPQQRRQLRRAGSLLMATVTSTAEARLAAEAGMDALCVQGTEAGGHQGSFDDVHERTTPLVDLLGAVRAEVNLPLVAAGGIADAAAARLALRAGAAAVQVGTVLLRCPESGASATHRAALADPRFTRTRVTRAFSGRRARGLENRFLVEQDAAAPAAYPQVHYLTGPLRAAAARRGEAEALHLWAGTGWRSASERPAAEVVAQLG
ncbi:nitronate monooxygenase [Lipingzhangella sp. LS1_29]|uniref:Propionate 3-nitronate monooxygenase n=1 Tax=Lipingzhangella rawalii TaxID=2055835 RepID=A0ABU2H135_9ACTN|nr:nitronate monooxygenase [Lipingzhangella rawalii]MDS1269016.1 nitronate monooxygenase [Lipingzhangella rawalii]